MVTGEYFKSGVFFSLLLGLSELSLIQQSFLFLSSSFLKLYGLCFPKCYPHLSLLLQFFFGLCPLDLLLSHKYLNLHYQWDQQCSHLRQPEFGSKQVLSAQVCIPLIECSGILEAGAATALFEFPIVSIIVSHSNFALTHAKRNPMKTALIFSQLCSDLFTQVFTHYAVFTFGNTLTISVSWPWAPSRLLFLCH